MRKEATRQKLLDKGRNNIISKKVKSTTTKSSAINLSNTFPNSYTFTNNSKTEHKDSGENKGCLWLIIAGLLIQALFSYLSVEMWFPF